MFALVSYILPAQEAFPLAFRAEVALLSVVTSSYAAIGGGFWLIASAWKVLHQAQQNGRLATAGPYARIRHPQYEGFILIMFGFLL